ncbi:MAG: hypothetical protein R3B91_00410 [Planctomycetaceae bacterium]
MIDTSASMGLEDWYSELQAASVANRLAQLAAPDAPESPRPAKSVLTAEHGDFLKKLQQSHSLQIYTFGGDGDSTRRGDRLG